MDSNRPHSQSHVMEGEWPKMSSQARRTLGSLRQRFTLFRTFYTFSAFILAASVTPFLILLCLGINVCRMFWLRMLERLYPELEFVSSTSVRTTVDTLRNQGIITVVLQVKGHCDIHQFRSKLQSEILDRKKNGQLVFPHLRTRLTSLWGWYAWCRGSDINFNINNHVAVTEAVYNSGLRDDLNCQKFISEMVSKYIRPDHPPWHLLVIPSADKFYVLIRLHHLYLSEERLGLGDLLLLEPDTHVWSEEVEEYLDHEHLLSGTFKTPVAIPQVYQHVCESFSNSWNELVSVYDPLENPKITCSTPTLKSFIILAAIVVVSIIKIHIRNENGNLVAIIKNETRRRGLTARLFWRSLLMTFHPVVVTRAVLMWVWWILVNSSLQLLRLALNIPVYFYWMILGYHVLRELVYLSKVIITAPRVLLRELLFPKPGVDSHHLQTVSLCGRKAVSWSEPVPLEFIHRIHTATGASSCEIMLAAVSASLRDYFRYLGFKVPQMVMTTARFIPQEKLLAQSASSVPHEGGLLCLDLPLWLPEEPFENLGIVQAALFRARANQAPLYLASLFGLDHSIIPKIFPSIIARIILNLLSRRYAVTITQVDATSTEKKRRRMLWGQEVEGIMYWRPPQANISLSLTIMSYGDSVRLGVMSDTQISPQHSVVSYNFDKHITQLATLAGVSRRPSRSSLDS
ncbi:uncharacterized protein LOC129000830 isoform X2 [Macrosteles quadrilineatus]|uniref:uncharacterized protein LOC129000830 isoform X2 n=1 Tax=Macrosteles quadrilineatus TaxID=74068 RepID=UPI0023E351D6|nr:uncharacterized protein LOC129000830 isoform X2 [Macrosteles quadrilineatus]